METVLISGINGFLGSRLAHNLISRYKVIGLESHTADLEKIKDLKINVYFSQDRLEKIFSENNISYIIHVATVYRRQNEPIETLLNTNILLPALLFELAEKYNVSGFLNTDSFFNSEQVTNYSYLQDYALSKQHALKWLKILQKKCKLFNLKIYHMYGPNDAPSKFVPFVINKLRKNEFIELTPGDQLRDFIFVDDVVGAIISVLQNADGLPIGSFYDYDIATGKNISIKEFVETAKRCINSSSTLNWGALPYRENEIMESVADNKELLKLGWNPKYNIEAGLVQLLKEENGF